MTHQHDVNSTNYLRNKKFVIQQNAPEDVLDGVVHDKLLYQNFVFSKISSTDWWMIEALTISASWKIAQRIKGTESTWMADRLRDVMND